MTRSQLSRLSIKDMVDGVAKWALHLSAEEHAALERLNPDTLGDHRNSKTNSEEWAKFIAHADSKPFRVQRV